MSETEKSKPKDSTSTSTTTSTVSSSSAVAAGNKVSSSIGSGSSGSTNATTKNSSSGSSGFASSSVSSSTSCSMTKHPCKPPPPLPPPPPPGSKHHHHHHHLLTAASANRARVPYPTAASVKKAFINFMKDPECLDKATDYLYESLIEDTVMGIYLEVHHSIKSGSLEAIEGQLEDGSAYEIVDTPNYDVFGMTKAKQSMDCICPNCDRLVATSKFAPHLEKCMGMGRKTSRTASRRLANAKEGNSSYFSSNVSDDEDDADWSSEKRRKKIQSSRTNGSKKNGKSS